MVTDYKKIDLFGKTFIQKIILEPPFEFPFPEANNACFLFSLEGEMQFHTNEEQFVIPSNYSLLLNCIHSGKKISNSASTRNEMVVISFHPDTLKKIYERELPLLIQKYIEGLLFYFENPSLVNEEILILKLKEIILLLSQTQNAEAIQVILSQLFSSALYTFKQIIEANIFLQVGVEDLAQKTNLSVSSFKREFTKLYNDSPANYIKTQRLEKAAKLLMVSNERITDIAFDCGFNDLANFTKSFHDKYSVTPTNYRLNLNKH
jgi:AraC-like DNA-binding protein